VDSTFFVFCFRGVVFRFNNNLERKNLNKSVRKSYFLTFWWNLHWCFYNGTRSLLILRSNYQFKNNNRFKKRIWFPQICVFTCISDFHSITSVSLDKLYQGSRNFSEQKFRFPWHQMKFTINWLFCPYRSNQHRSWTVLHSHLSYWWTVILSYWKNGGKHAQHNEKQDPHSLFLQTGNLPSSSCVSIRIFNLTSQIDIE
jgi:hypothetical protein